MRLIQEDIKNILLGTQSCYIKVVYGSSLRIGLGEKIFYDNPQLEGRFHGEWNILSRYSGWRILKNNKIICGFDNEIKDCNNILKSADTGKLLDIVQLNEYDLRLIFENGYTIDFLCQSTDEPIVSIVSKNSKVEFDLTLNGWIQYRTDETSQKMNTIETALSSQSDECQNRWSKLIRISDTDNKCRDCFYFRGIYGGFYFWDYGLCSNGDSENDGKLVNVMSGCDFLKHLGDITE